MRFRKLRIAWSIIWGLACALLIVFWMRSYYVGDVVQWSATKWCGFQLTSMQDEFTARQCSLDGAGHHGGMEWPNWRWSTARPGSFGPTTHRFEIRPWFYIAFPYWAPIVVSAVLAAAPWFLWRVHNGYSLRTLLIATTVLGLLLGLMVYGMR